MTATAVLPPTIADTGRLDCPLPACPLRALGRPLGSVWAPVGDGQPWRSTSAHRPGHVHATAGVFAAARWILAEHQLHEHDTDRDDPQLLTLMATAAYDFARAAAGRPPLQSAAFVGYCGVCLAAVTSDGTAWIDDEEDAYCPGVRELCDRGCWPTPGRPHLADPPCGVCGGDSAIPGLHEPVPYYVAPAARQDEGPR